MARATADTGCKQNLIAGAVVIVVHLLLAWLLVRAGMVVIAGQKRATALQVTWIYSPAPPPVQARPASFSERNESPTRPAIRRHRSRPAAPDPIAADAATDTAEAQVLPLSATFIEQARALARDSTPASIAAANPFADRVASLPAADRGRFRMHRPITPADIVEEVGRLFGGGPTDPCPRIDGNLANLGTGGDSDLMREELRRKRAYCH